MPSGRFMGRALAWAVRAKRVNMASTRAGMWLAGSSNNWACNTRFWRTLSSSYSEKLCDM